MAKAKLKNDKTQASVQDFLKSIKDDQQRKDSIAIVSMMEKAAGEPPKMWGAAIVGFGDVYLKYESGRELDWFRIGFSPRKQNLTLYGLLGRDVSADLFKKLGKYKTTGGCLYVKKLEDIDQSVFEKILKIKFAK